MIKCERANDGGGFQYSYQSSDVQKLRRYLIANQGHISAALRSLEAEGMFEGLGPREMIEVVRFAEKALKDPHWCTPEWIAELKTKKISIVDPQ